MSTASLNPGAGTDGAAALGAVQYTLSSDLVQFCLPAAGRDQNRKFAYANSICFAFLVVGLIGLREPNLKQKDLPVVVVDVPIVFTPPPEEVKIQPENPPQPDETPPDATADTTPMVATVVAANAAAVSFAVPVEGPVILAPAKYAPPPPAVTKAPPSPPKPKVVRFGETRGIKGRFPPPPFDFVQDIGARSGEVYSGEVRIEIGPDGAPVKVEIERTCGSVELDRKVVRHIKIRFRFEMPAPSSVFIYPFEYKIQ